MQVAALGARRLRRPAILGIRTSEMGASRNVRRAFSQAADLAGAGRLSHAAPAAAARGDPGRGGNTGRRFALRSALKSSKFLVGADELGAGDDVRLHRRLELVLR